MEKPRMVDIVRAREEYTAPESALVRIYRSDALCLSQGSGTTETYTEGSLDWDD